MIQRENVGKDMLTEKYNPSRRCRVRFNTSSSCKITHQEDQQQERDQILWFHHHCQNVSLTKIWPGNRRELMLDFILIVYWVKCSFWRSFFWQSEGFDFWNPLFQRNNGVDLDCREMPLPTPPSSLRRPHWYGRRLAHISTQKLEHLDHSGIGATHTWGEGGGASDTHKAHHLGNWWRFPECSHMRCLMPRRCEGNSVYLRS